MSIWSFLGGAAAGAENYLQQQDKLETFRLQQEAEYKRQQKLEEWRLQKEQDFKREEEERHKNDVSGHIMDPNTGDIIAMKKNGEPVVVRAGDPNAIALKNQRIQAEIDAKRAAADASAAVSSARQQMADVALERLGIARDKAAQEAAQRDPMGKSIRAAQEDYSKFYNSNLKQMVDPDNPDVQPDPQAVHERTVAQMSRFHSPEVMKATFQGYGTQPTPSSSSMSIPTIGSSRQMPLVVNPGDPKPPKGTWAMNALTGEIKQIE